MADETFTILHYAGPATWHQNIAPSRTDMDPNAIITNIGSALNACIGPRSTELNILTLAELSVAANLLSNKIANTIFVADAQTTFKDARMVANILDAINKTPHPAFVPPFKKTQPMMRAARSNDPAVLSMLLIDVIRIAYHITERGR